MTVCIRAPVVRCVCLLRRHHLSAQGSSIPRRSSMYVYAHTHTLTYADTKLYLSVRRRRWEDGDDEWVSGTRCGAEILQRCAHKTVRAECITACMYTLVFVSTVGNNNHWTRCENRNRCVSPAYAGMLYFLYF